MKLGWRKRLHLVLDLMLERGDLRSWERVTRLRTRKVTSEPSKEFFAEHDWVLPATKKIIEGVSPAYMMVPGRKSTPGDIHYLLGEKTLKELMSTPADQLPLLIAAGGPGDISIRIATIRLERDI